MQASYAPRCRPQAAASLTARCVPLRTHHGVLPTQLRRAPLRLWPAVCSAAADSEGPGPTDGGSSSRSGGSAAEGSNTPSGAPSGSQPSAVSVPLGLAPSPGAAFFLAGFLKILILCYPYSEMAVSMWLNGRADLGTWAAVKMIPLALGLAALAKAVLDRGWHKRKWGSRLIVLGGLVALLLSRAVFSRPKPSVLDPEFENMRMRAMSERAEQQRETLAMQERRRRLQPPPEDARERLASGGRFSQ